MATTALARKPDEPFCVIEEPIRMLSPVAHIIASDEDVHAASSHVLAEHIEAYKELARYDSCQ